MGTGTGLGRVRGYGSAKHGSHHWWMLRLTSIGDLLLESWLIFSLLRLPDLSYTTVHSWLMSPLAAVPMALLIINMCWHLRLGLAEPIEDYVHGGARVVTMGILHLWTFAVGGFALFALFKIAFTAASAATGAPAQ
jgi:succinate dehydrogenase / fumarate reductase, membrane anchor subunit